jgi:hypothetical protein
MPSLQNQRQRDRVAAAEFAANLRTKLVEQHQEELTERQAATEELVSALGTIALAAATRGRGSIGHLAARQSVLARAQLTHARAYPKYVIIRRVRVIHCDGIGRSLRCSLQ